MIAPVLSRGERCKSPAVVVCDRGLRVPTPQRAEGLRGAPDLLDEAPVPLVVMAMEEAAANEGVAPMAVWRNVAKLAMPLAVLRQGLWA